MEQISSSNATAIPGHASRSLPPILALLLIAIVATGPGWLPRRVYVPTDSAAGNPLVRSEACEFVPWTIYAAQRLRHAEVPLWNPYAGLGQPLLANGVSAVFYPTILLHMFLAPTWSWTLAAMLRLWLAGCGVWLLAGRYGLSGVPRLLSAAAFMLCGFNVLYINHPIFNTIAWLPWSIIVIHRLIDRPTLGRVIVGALVFAVQFLGGNPGASIHLLLTCGLLYLAHLVWLDPLKAIKALPATLLAAGVGFALAGVQWLPMIDSLNQSTLATFAPHLPARLNLAGLWIGVIPLLLAAVGVLRCRNKKPVVLWLLIGAVAAAIAFVEPGAGLMATPSLSLAILCGFGLQSLVDLIRDGAPWPLLRRPTVRAICGSPWPWLGLALVELLTIAILRNPGAVLSTYYPVTPSLAWLQQERYANLNAPWRLGAMNGMLPPNTSTAYHLPDVRSNENAMTSSRYSDWMRQLDGLSAGKDPAKATNLLAMRYLVLPPAQAPPAGGTGDWKQVFPPPAPSSVPTTAPTPPRADAVVYENPAALPRAWMATRAEGFATQAQAVARTRAMDFDPRELVIGDWDIDSDDFEWLTRPNSRMRQAKPLSPQEYFGVRGRDVGARTSREARIIWLEDSPERVRLRIENGGGGWLVLADAYMNGWQAKINNPAWGAYERDRPIVPAYGLLRTLRVNESANETVDVIMEYRPAAYHRGLMLTTGAAAALVLLLGFWFIGVRRNGKIQPPEGASWTNGFGSTARSCG